MPFSLLRRAQRGQAGHHSRMNMRIPNFMCPEGAVKSLHCPTAGGGGRRALVRAAARGCGPWPPHRRSGARGEQCCAHAMATRGARRSSRATEGLRAALTAAAVSIMRPTAQRVSTPRLRNRRLAERWLPDVLLNCTRMPVVSSQAWTNYGCRQFEQPPRRVQGLRARNLEISEPVMPGLYFKWPRQKA